MSRKKLQCFVCQKSGSRIGSHRFSIGLNGVKARWSFKISHFIKALVTGWEFACRLLSTGLIDRWVIAADRLHAINCWWQVCQFLLLSSHVSYLPSYKSSFKLPNGQEIFYLGHPLISTLLWHYFWVLKHLIKQCFRFTLVSYWVHIGF